VRGNRECDKAAVAAKAVEFKLTWINRITSRTENGQLLGGALSCNASYWSSGFRQEFLVAFTMGDTDIA
jgi:hypothetical protein